MGEAKVERVRRVLPEYLSKDWMTCYEAGDELEVNRLTIYRMGNDGTLESKRFGKMMIVTRRSVAAFKQKYELPESSPSK